MHKFTVVKKFHFDAGHRIWNHNILNGIGSALISEYSEEISNYHTKCANPHGHTFYVEVHIESNKIDKQGMIIDTDAIKFIIKEIEQLLDHSYILQKDDPILHDFINIFQGYKVVVIDVMPTAEGIAKYIYLQFKDKLKKILSKDIRLKCVIVKISNSIIGKFEEV